MGIKTAMQAKIEFLQILDQDGKLDESLGRDLLEDADVKSLYEQMVISRFFDETAFKLQRSGRMGTFPQNKGQEAAALGAARALIKGTDYLVPYYRENPALFMHGLPMHYILLHWMGDERGNQIPKNLSMNALCVAIGCQTLHAVGIAWAFKQRQEKKVVVVFFGEGATSTGDVHEAMNIAAVMQVPVIFSCINNRWAISVPSKKQNNAQTYAQRAIGYGMPGMQVDGNDIFAVYKAHKEAADRARDGGGPSFIESVTYRLADHTTADDARRYRSNEELEAAYKGDPLVRTRKYLESKNIWDADQQKKIEERAKVIVAEVQKVALGIEPPATEDIFDYTFAELPEDLIRQKHTMRTDSIGQDPSQIGLKSPRERKEPAY